MTEDNPAERKASSSSPGDHRTAREMRLASHAQRTRAADATIGHSLRQWLWSARREGIETIRPIGRRMLAPLIPRMRILQKKLQRPPPRVVDYRSGGSAEKPLI